MFFFGKNLKAKHKATLCLALLGILANYWACTWLPGTFPFIEFIGDYEVKFHATQLILSLGIFIKMLIICIFRKF